jgi:hypothetical protein
MCERRFGRITFEALLNVLVVLVMFLQIAPFTFWEMCRCTSLLYNIVYSLGGNVLYQTHTPAEQQIW